MSAHNRGKSYREEQHRGKKNESFFFFSFFTKVYSEVTLFALTKIYSFTTFITKRITIIYEPIDHHFLIHT